MKLQYLQLLITPRPPVLASAIKIFCKATNVDKFQTFFTICLSLRRPNLNVHHLNKLLKVQVYIFYYFQQVLKKAINQINVKKVISNKGEKVKSLSIFRLQ